jgi:glyoxylase-like metal-dependent hydrolase (beta-lactamase superfamily II)/rhodanese-related sulfurtransferase
MIFKQYYLGCLSQASYLIGDERTHTAAVVDPRRDIDEYLDDAAHNGLVIKHVILTHFHADFVAGHLELQRRAGATIHLGAQAKAEYDFHPLEDGDALELGDVRLEILETPGHTPESISIVVVDLASDPHRPYAVLTGDTLFIGDVGRPDLLASVGVSAETLAGMLYESVHGKLLRLPNDTLLYPGHGAGSACGKNLSVETVSTIGAQRATNYALQPMSRQEFVHRVVADQPEAPAYFGYDADLNRREHATLDDALARELRPLTLGDVLRAQRSGAQVLDTRAPEEFAAGHLAGSMHIGLGGRFASWAGTLLSPENPIVLVCAPGHEREAAVRLGRVGLDRVIGYLGGGIEATKGLVVPVRHPARITSDLLGKRLGRGPIPLIDVRAESEWRQEAIRSSVNIPLQHLRKRIAEIPEGPIVVYCRTGERSSTAASLLEQTGRMNVVDLVGGIAAWKASGQNGTVSHVGSGVRHPMALVDRRPGDRSHRHASRLAPR